MSASGLPQYHPLGTQLARFRRVFGAAEFGLPRCLWILTARISRCPAAESQFGTRGVGSQSGSPTELVRHRIGKPAPAPSGPEKPEMGRTESAAVGAALASVALCHLALDSLSPLGQSVTCLPWRSHEPLR